MPILTPILTLEAIRANPWNAVYHRLPFYPGSLMVWTAASAVDYCRSSELDFIRAAREGHYWPGNAALHKRIEERWRRADDRLEKLWQLF
jgi:hypothetical protein